MAQVCRRWKVAVQGHDGVWKAVCVWRWPWLSSEEGMRDMESMVYRDPRRAAMVGEEESAWSMWLELCTRAGCCLLKVGAGCKTDQ